MQRKNLTGSIWCLALFSICSKSAFALEAKEIFKIAEPSVVVVLASDAKGEKNTTGSGVIVTPAEIVTSCRVLDAAVDIVITQGSALRKATLRFRDPERDLCQVHVDDPIPSGKPAVLAAAPGEIETGQELFVIGAPRGMERTIARAMVSGLRDAGTGKGRLMQIDLPVSDGSIGAGMFDQSGHLVGIAAGKFRAGDNASYAVPAEWIAELPERSADLMLSPVAPKAAQPGASQSAQVATPPGDAKPGSIPRAGDRWKYRLIDGKKPIGIVSVEIVDSNDKTVRERITREDEKRFVVERTVDAVFKPAKFQEVVTMPGGFQIEEISPYAIAEQDLKAGQQWTEIPASFQFVWFGKKSILMQARVIRKEKVRVAAGEFEATLLEATGKENFSGGGVKVTCKYWYAPQMKRSVKMTLQIDYTVSVMNSSVETYELTAFEPAK